MLQFRNLTIPDPVAVTSELSGWCATAGAVPRGSEAAEDVLDMLYCNVHAE
jgi:hypothetical protein